jgi:hypothetical protein
MQGGDNKTNCKVNRLMCNWGWDWWGVVSSGHTGDGA